MMGVSDSNDLSCGPGWEAKKKGQERAAENMQRRGTKGHHSIILENGMIMCMMEEVSNSRYQDLGMYLVNNWREASRIGRSENRQEY